MNFNIKDFTGPLDLMLHMVKKHELDIYEIDLKIIIDEYINFINSLDKNDLDNKSEYLVMASELIHLKSKIILGFDEEEDDEYEKYQTITNDFRELEKNRQDYFTKVPESLKEYANNETYLSDDVSLEDLVNAMLEISERLEYKKPRNTKIARKEISVKDKINYIKENYLKDNKIYFSIIPDKNHYVSNGNLKLDYKKMEDIMKNNLEYAKYIDMFSLLSLDNYYKTDTHWKEETLINVANSLSKNMNFNLSNTYNSETLSSFKGVYKGQLPINISNDNIVILTNDTIKNSKVYNYEDNSVGDVYNISKLSGLDKYDVYLSGASSLLTITNKQNNTNRELIVFRDSYASSLIPLIIEGYRKITLVDTRYISPKILDNYIDFDNQDIYFLYSALLINDSYSMK